ncbi:TfoX/Sxy family protein [Marinagarivorans algicola]|uniref:TfoX/Sxy family protein n=1 Tax=Marinagarivorans algicola TaxID=1513270 RepID=UPI0006B590FE|nr:TfoX/Sxy family protein [Marinagarivorans algicola]
MPANAKLKNQDLLELRNLGMASVNILHAVGINTYQDLEDVGAVDTYRRIKDRGIHVSKVMLYALQGALMDVHWNDLPASLKAQLVNDAEEPAKVAELNN